MREVFAKAELAPADPGEVFYTIQAEDVGKAVIQTEVGPVHVGDFMGRIQPVDVDKRLYRRQNISGDWWYWQIENNEQRDERLRAGD